MNLPLVSNEEIKNSGSGQIVITENDIRTIPQDQINDVLSKEYTRMVQENPEHEFWILKEETFNPMIMISWRLRE
jgi:hypothetical protein